MFYSDTHRAWDMYTVFYELFFISDKQLFYAMKFLNAMML